MVHLLLLHKKKLKPLVSAINKHRCLIAAITKTWRQNHMLYFKNIFDDKYFNSKQGCVIIISWYNNKILVLFWKLIIDKQYLITSTPPTETYYAIKFIERLWQAYQWEPTVKESHKTTIHQRYFCDFFTKPCISML